MLTSLPRDSGGDPIAVSPDGNYIYFILNRGHASGPLYKYDLNAGQMIALGEVQAPKAFSGMQFTSDGTLYAIDGKNYGTKRLWTLDLNSLEATPVGPELFGINEMEAGGLADALELGPDCIMYLLITPEALSWPSNPHPTEYVGTIDLSTGLATINWNAPISGFDHCDTMAIPPGPPCILVVPIDIRPASCFNPLNVYSKGVLPVAVLGTEEFDVNDIDIASIRLADVAPFKSNYLDITGPESEEPNACGCTATCPDGYTDLTLKFRTIELVEVLTEIYGEINEGDELELNLTGELYDGSMIEGLDYITVVGQVPHRLNNPDLNNDGVIDLLDFALLAEHWLKQ